MQNFETLGLFYLGKILGTLTGKPGNDLLLYESKNLTTHAVCVGMTGSGKTGLGITILEEAALDKIPAIIIDPKGDLSNLLLTFPNLSPEAFKPWVDLVEAEKKGMNTDEYSAYLATTWKDGLAAWGENAERIQHFRNSVELAIYTPASQAGIPISILSSFAAPSKDQMLDSTLLREKILSTISSLLGLLGISTDPLKSREHILLSNLIQYAWQNGTNLDMAILIQQVQKPPFSKIGALDVDTVYPPKERMELSICLNNLLASPGFQAWMQGQSLDIAQLLYTNTGKPKLSIISIAHLSDTERMFFVTLFLNEFVTWTRRQTGTSSLRALLYMDEIFGFFPPTAMPPSKLPMLTLLKQARAFGVGIILATQNPVDLDYKGLANCGTWFIGKLQTDRDKARVLEGLKVASNGEIETGTFDKMLSLTGRRIFIMHSIYEQNPIIFQTRWTLSYMRGPLTLPQIANLTPESAKPVQEKPSFFRAGDNHAHSSAKPNAPLGISEYFVVESASRGAVHYEPKVAGITKIHFVDSKYKIDFWQKVCFLLSATDDGKNVPWEDGENIADLENRLQKEFLSNSTFGELPSGLMQEKNYALFAKQLASALYQNQSLTLYQTNNPNMVSTVDESERDFRVRVAQELREKRDDMVKKLREKYGAKISALSEKVQRAQAKTTQKKQRAGLQIIQTIISFGSALLSAIIGRRLSQSTISQTGTTLRRASQVGKDSEDATQAEEEVKKYQQELQDLEAQMNVEISSLIENCDSERIKVDTLSIRPRKSNVLVEKVALIWWSA